MPGSSPQRSAPSISRSSGAAGAPVAQTIAQSRTNVSAVTGSPSVNLTSVAQPEGERLQVVATPSTTGPARAPHRPPDGSVSNSPANTLRSTVSSAGRRRAQRGDRHRVVGQHVGDRRPAPAARRPGRGPPVAPPPQPARRRTARDQCCEARYSQRVRTRDDLEDLLGDRCLSGTVHLQRVVVDQHARVLGRVAHRGHSGAVLGRRRLEQRAVDRDLEVRRDELAEHLGDVRLVLVRALDLDGLDAGQRRLAARAAARPRPAAGRAPR